MNIYKLIILIACSSKLLCMEQHEQREIESHEEQILRDGQRSRLFQFINLPDDLQRRIICENIKYQTPTIESLRSFDFVGDRFAYLSGNRIASISNGTITIYDTNSYRIMQVLRAHSQIGKLINLSEGKIATSSGTVSSFYRDSSIKIWDINSGRCLRTLEGISQFDDLIYLGNNLIAFGAIDKTIKICDIESGECIRTLIGHAVSSISAIKIVNLENNLIASKAQDETIIRI